MYVIHRQCASRVRAAVPADSKESHNQSFEISFRRAASEKGEKSRLGFIILTMVGAVVQSATLHSLLPTSYSTSFSLLTVALPLAAFRAPPLYATLTRTSTENHTDPLVPLSHVPFSSPFPIPLRAHLDRPMHA